MSHPLCKHPVESVLVRGPQCPPHSALQTTRPFLLSFQQEISPDTPHRTPVRCPEPYRSSFLRLSSHCPPKTDCRGEEANQHSAQQRPVSERAAAESQTRLFYPAASQSRAADPALRRPCRDPAPVILRTPSAYHRHLYFYSMG